MKALIILMLIFSFFVGIPTNLGWFVLFSGEITGPISEMTAGQFPTYRMLNWCLLILSHASVVSLLFLTKKAYFDTILLFFPLLFIVIFTLYDIFSFFLLIPFIIIWAIALFKKPRKALSSVN